MLQQQFTELGWGHLWVTVYDLLQRFTFSSARYSRCRRFIHCLFEEAILAGRTEPTNGATRSRSGLRYQRRAPRCYRTRQSFSATKETANTIVATFSLVALKRRLVYTEYVRSAATSQRVGAFACSSPPALALPMQCYNVNANYQLQATSLANTACPFFCVGPKDSSLAR